ncbi:gp53-like domain-containing protein [Sphingomonas paucimobilis]|uniref:gp53-like domain-containing protein n=1 Tax=Sphingomonas paucimobilis TaxID=13689 RepID=UPI003D957E16
MTALKLTMTTAGLGRFTAAQASDDIDLTIARVGLTATAFVAAPTLTALPGEFKRLATVSGSVEAQNIVHMTVTDDDPVTYTVRGFGLFLADGTLFATYAQATPIGEKSTGAMLALAIDIAFPVAGVENISFGSTNFLNPPGTEGRKGVVELARLDEANAGDATRVTTGAVVKAMIASALDMVTQALAGITARTFYGSGLVKGGGDLTANRTFTVDAASATEVLAGTRGDVAITPAGLAALAGSIATNGEFQIAPGVFVKTGVTQGPHGEGSVAINFATPFPNVCLIAVGVAINASGRIECDSYVQERALSPATFTAFVQKQAADSANIDAIRWIAVGR